MTRMSQTALAVITLSLMSGCGNESPAEDIWKASAEGDVDAVKRHLDAGTDMDATFVLAGVPGSGGAPLHLAVLGNQPKAIELLIDHGANLNRQSDNAEGGTPLTWAAALGHAEVARILVDAGADLNVRNKTGATPLDATTSPLAQNKAAQAKVADMLQKAGASRNLTTPPAPAGVDELFAAVMNDDTAAVRKLVKDGAPVDVRDPQRATTPLILAAIFGKSKAAEALIEASADLEAVNADGTRPLMAAAFFGHPETVRQLLEAGAHPAATDREGRTPLAAVTVPWSNELEGTYRFLFGALQLPFDAAEIKRQRPIIADILRDHRNEARPAARRQRHPAPVSDSSRMERVAAVGEGDWPTYNATPNGWRHNPYEKTLHRSNADRLSLVWQFPPEDSGATVGVIHATPSVVDGHVYFGTATQPMFYCLSPAGAVVWQYEIGGVSRRLMRVAAQARGLTPQDGVYTSALITDDSVCFADTAGVMYCLDRATGKERWQVDSKGRSFPGAHHANLVMASPILADGKVVFGGGAYEHPLPTDKSYDCCYGRGFVVALTPETGEIAWKYDVGPEPEEFDPPIVIEDEYGKHVFKYGPSTSSVWSTPSWDKESNTVFFGTDIHNSPRRPTAEDPSNYTAHSAAVIAVDAADGHEKWVSQVAAGDVWNHSMPAYDTANKQYKDLAVGDTPKVYAATIDGESVPVVGAGCKNGGYYVMDRGTGRILAQTPVYTGPPSGNPDTDPRMLALPSPIGGLQTGCATDGQRVYANGIDKLPHFPGDYWKPNPPTGGRVTCLSANTADEHWRHERPKIDWIGGTADEPLFTGVGDPVASGIALAGELAFFTTFSSNKLVCLDADTGSLLKEIDVGPVLSGPSVSRGRVYVGTGNTQFANIPAEAFFPKQFTGKLLVFGIADDQTSADRPQWVPEDIDYRTDAIVSEGTRMHAEVFTPKGAEGELPAIVMSHGWGGTAEALRPDAVAFAQAGFLTVAFDYRGWGGSDARLIATGKPASKDGKLIAEVKEVRGVVDPIDQTTDILNAIHWVAGEPRCDAERIGIWGSSFSGGHVLYVAARDRRIKALVSQVGSMDARWVVANPQVRQHTYSQGTGRARGTIGYPEPFAPFGGMRGQPVWEKLIGYTPIEDADRSPWCAKLFLVAENEELFDNAGHAIAAHQKATGPKKLVMIEGIKHYGIYNEKRAQARCLAIDWFTEHLKSRNTDF